MIFSDIIFILQWWLVLFLIGIIFLPLTIKIFPNFFDRGYIFSKTLGILLISYSVWFLGSLKILPFSILTIILVTVFFLLINMLISRRLWRTAIKQCTNRTIIIFLFEEIIFLMALFFWSYVRAHEPSIHGLEKFMDFGFVNSILRTDYFPPKDIWLTPETINYYYFGHLVTAVLTKLSGIDSAITYNLMLAALFALTFTGAFSIGANLFRFSTIAGDAKARGGTKFSQFAFCTTFQRYKLQLRNKKISVPTSALFSGFLTAFLVTLSGNLQTIYLFFKGFLGENPQPPWTLLFSPGTFPNNYWYPNATRFIPFTIHEFPSYSFVVADIHSHVLGIPIVLLTIAVLLSFFFRDVILKPKELKNLSQEACKKNEILRFAQNDIIKVSLISLLLAALYMTNAWDGLIYFFLSTLVIIYLQWLRIKRSKISNTTNNPILQILPINKKIQNLNHFLLNHWVINLLIGLFVYWLILGIGSILLSLPFTLNFKPFVSGIGLLCAPNFLTKIGHLGPFLFEAGHCQRSPLWQLLILYGFFYFWAILFIFKILKLCHWELLKNLKLKISRACILMNYENLLLPDIFVLILIILSTLLILLPEFIYLKDIYPAHYRANTMFKLTYQAFILLSIVAGYTIVRIITNFKFQISNIKYYWKLGYWIIGIIGLFLVLVYPYFAIDSYYNSLKNYQGLNGLTYLKNLYPEDYEGILWLRKNIQSPPVGEASQPVILEAQGDSYTDFARVSANTGLPTVIGWPVHEWLWRGSYEIAAPRIADVQAIYETPDLNLTKTLVRKYNISLIFVGDLERQKYQVLEKKFESLGKIIFQSGQTKIYKIN